MHTCWRSGNGAHTWKDLHIRRPGCCQTAGLCWVFAKFSAHILRSYIQMQHETFSFATLFFYERDDCEVEIEKEAALRRCWNHAHEIVHAVGPLLIPYSVMSVGISITHLREASGASAEASSSRSRLFGALTRCRGDPSSWAPPASLVPCISRSHDCSYLRCPRYEVGRRTVVYCQEGAAESTTRRETWF